MKTLNGIKVFENLNMVDTVTIQRKTHRRKRINKKWAKRYGFISKSIPKKEIFHVKNIGFIGHPETIKAVFEKIALEG